jgi:hypothetical protein
MAMIIAGSPARYCGATVRLISRQLEMLAI